MKRFCCFFQTKQNVVLLIECSFHARTSYELVVQLRFTDLVRNAKWRILLNTVGEKYTLKDLHSLYEMKVVLLPEAEWHSQQ